MKFTVRDITTTAAAAALVFTVTAVTALLGIPLRIFGGEGYFNLGDAVIFLCAFLLGGYRAALAAAIGSALSDVMLGYMVYAVPTFVIKGAMGFAAGGICCGNNFLRFAFACIVGAVIMASGYTVFEYFFFAPEVALANIPGNVLQGTAAVICSAVLFMPIARLKHKLVPERG